MFRSDVDNIRIIVEKTDIYKSTLFEYINGVWEILVEVKVSSKVSKQPIYDIDYMNAITKSLKSSTKLSVNAIKDITVNFSREFRNYEKNNDVVAESDWEVNLDEAKDIYQSGKAMETILKATDHLHKGDDMIKKVIILSMISPYVTNSKGIWMHIRGKPGIGKSGSIRAIIKTNPYAYERQFSSKGLYYHDVQEFDTVYFDDSEWDDDMVMLLKQYNWDDGLQRSSVKDNEGQDMSLPPHVTMLSTSNFDIEDPGLKDRFWYHYYADNIERRDNSFEGIFNSFNKKEEFNEESIYSLWAVLKKSRRDIDLHFDLEHFELILDKVKRRSNQMFYSIALSVAFINNHDKLTEDDINETVDIMNYMIAKNKMLTPNEEIVLEYLEEKTACNATEISKGTKLSKFIIKGVLDSLIYSGLINLEGRQYVLQNPYNIRGK